MRKLKNTKNWLISKNLNRVLNPHFSDSETHALTTKFCYIPQSNSKMQGTSPSAVGGRGRKWEKHAVCFSDI